MGKALRVIYADCPKDYVPEYQESCMDKLEARYAAEETVESHIHTFQQYKQKPKQSVPDYIDELSEKATLAYGDDTPLQKVEKLRAQFLTGARSIRIREAVAVNTGPRSTTAELALVAVRRENFEGRNDIEGTEKADVKAFSTVPGNKVSGTQGASADSGSAVMKEVKALGKSMHSLTDTVNRLKAPVRDAANVSNAQRGSSLQYSGAYGGNFGSKLPSNHVMCVESIIGFRIVLL